MEVDAMRATASASLPFVLLLTTVPALSAAEPATPAPVALPAVEETLVVTATAEEEERRDVPATVRIVTGDEARARHVESVAELLATVPGAHVVTLGALGQQTSLFLRGSESDQSLVLWNGLPLNDPYAGRFDWAFLSTAGLDRVEVVPGPFSALYGSSALGGVVQVLTTRATRTGGTLEAGERSHRRAALSTGRAAGPWHLDLGGQARESDGALDAEDYAGEELAARVAWRARPNVELGLVGRWGDASTRHPFNGLGSSPDRRTDVEQRQWGVPVVVEAGGWELAGSLSQVRYDFAFRDPTDPFFFTSQDTTSRGDRARAVGTRRFAGGWWAGGADWERLRIADRNSFSPVTSRGSQRTAAAFTQLHLEGARWSAELGLRHDDNDAYGTTTSPRLGLAWAVLPALRLRGSYGEGFRAPTVSELFGPFGNPELRAERGRSVEVGAELAHGAWRLDLAAFENRHRDLIDFSALGLGNVAESRSRGLEAELAYAVGAGEVRLGGLLLDAENLQTGAELRRRPRESAHLVAIARPGRATLALTAAWVGERADLDPSTFADASNPAFTTVDVAAAWQALPWLAPFVRVLNAFDEEYAPALGYPAAGRTVIAGVRLDR
jgi:vitamin B12 transporter